MIEYRTLRMEKKNSILKKMHAFLVKVVNRSIYIHVMRIHRMLISYVRLDHTLYLINYGTMVLGL